MPNDTKATNDWRKRPRFWTPERLNRLRYLIASGWSYERIGREFGKSRESINLARKRNGIECTTHTFLTARNVATMMGFGCAKKVSWLIETGRLKGRWNSDGRGGNTKRGCWSIVRSDVIDFILDESHWHLWDWQDITDSDLKRRAFSARGSVRFMSAAEVAHMHFVELRTVNQWASKGWLPYRRIGNGNHVYPESAVRAFEPPHLTGRRMSIGLPMEGVA